MKLHPMLHSWGELQTQENIGGKPMCAKVI